MNMHLFIIFMIAFCFNVHAYASASDLSVLRGSITDAETGEPLKFVTIRAIGPESKAAVTSKQGSYLLRLKEGEYTLTFSMVGYTSATKHITLPKPGLTLNMQLSQSAFRSA
ncbi:MAG: carboxypeptidase-like regulatory domain-containing protein [Ignavibacteria bacterium]